MKSIQTFLAATLLASGLSACGHMGGHSRDADTSPTAGPQGLLVDGQGMTLYTFAKDARNSGISECYGGCATLWPPALAGAGAKAEGKLTFIIREDGQRQWSHNGHPLYRYAHDAKAGDRQGDGLGGNWKTVAP